MVVIIVFRSILNWMNSKNVLWYDTTQCTEKSWFLLSPWFFSSDFTSWLWLWMCHLISVTLILLSGKRVKWYLLSCLYRIVVRPKLLIDDDNNKKKTKTANSYVGIVLSILYVSIHLLLITILRSLGVIIIPPL